MGKQLSMILGNATTHWHSETYDWVKCVESWLDRSSAIYDRYEVYRKPMMEAYQEIYTQTHEDIISYMHDDLIILEQDWDLRVLKEFEDPDVGAVGFFGGRGHGTPDMYTKPFDPYSFIRIDTISNLVADERGGTTAEQNGERFTGSCDVACFDGLAIFLRRETLDAIGGWPQDRCLAYWGYDLSISALVRRAGYRNRFVGVKCNHLGGKSPSILWEGQPTDVVNKDWLAAHQYLWDNYRDVLPAMVR